jgi:hypothetical protein
MLLPARFDVAQIREFSERRHTHTGVKLVWPARLQEG